jgi:hypothetical protein
LLRIVRDLRRVHSHLASIAYPVLRRSTTGRRRKTRDLLREEPDRLDTP